MTERLYQTDSYATEFEATVLEARSQGEGFAVVLDRTAFYPASGGQPHDTGTLGGVPVTEVREDEDDRIVHLAAGRVEGTVTGRIDWPRRFDHMQQHTGQHILSQAFLQALRAQTRAVHLGAALSTLDLDLGDLTAEEAGQAEDLANQIVFENRPVIIRKVDESELVDLGLRRPPKKHGLIRVVEVEGFDRSACGGTHVRRTGEVGPIAIRRWERFKGGLRVEFLCGWRALRDHRWKSALVLDLAARFTVKDAELPEAVRRMNTQLKERERALSDAMDRLLHYEASQYLAGAAGDPKVIAQVVEDRTSDQVAALAGKVASAKRVVVVFGTPQGRIVAARSSDLDLDAREILKRAIEPFGGRGGGRAEFAQGAVAPERVADATAAARKAALGYLSRA